MEFWVFSLLVGLSKIRSLAECKGPEEPWSIFWLIHERMRIYT